MVDQILTQEDIDAFLLSLEKGEVVLEKETAKEQTPETEKDNEEKS